MTKHWISYLLIALIACQSVLAFADSHEAYLPGVEHLEFEHDHDDKSDITKNNSTATDLNSTDSSTGNTYDCHHCCHCHLFLSSTVNHIKTSAYQQSPPRYQLAYLSNILLPDFRPPIA